MSDVAVLELVGSMRAGGGPRHVLALATALAARGFVPVVAGPPDGPMVDRFREAGVETVALATDRLTPFSLLRLARLVRARSIRLIHSHGKGAGLYGRVAARLTGVPAVHTHHGLHFERYAPPARAAYLALERRLARWTTTIVNVSRAQEREGLALRLFSPAQSRVIVNGVDGAGLRAAALDRAAARRALGLAAASSVVGAAARFDEVKRLDLVLEAAARIDDPALRVLLIGGGPEDSRLRARAGGPDLRGRVRFAGESGDAGRLLRALDVYVAPSRKEGLPLAVLEAMALGVPVVASDIQAHREVLGPQAPGLVAATAPALAAAITALLRDPDARARLAQANAERVRAFDAVSMVNAVVAVYREALGPVVP